LILLPQPLPVFLLCMRRGTNTNAVAEQAIALMFALAKHLVPAHEALKQNGDYGYRLRVRSCELKGKTLGLVGLGNIGRRVAAFCQLGFGDEKWSARILFLMKKRLKQQV
jgi:phosphoglycerate dehydrogenase-like enzyme